jgi:hypothetical protein
MDIKIVEEDGLFRVYVDGRSILGPLSETEAEELVALIRRHIDEYELQRERKFGGNSGHRTAKITNYR